MGALFVRAQAGVASILSRVISNLPVLDIEYWKPSEGSVFLSAAWRYNDVALQLQR